MSYTNPIKNGCSGRLSSSCYTCATQLVNVSFLVLYTGFTSEGRSGSYGIWVSNWISASHSESYEFESHTWWGVFDTTLCDKVCQWFVRGLQFPSVFSTNKTYYYNITEILLKVALNTKTLTSSIRNASVVICITDLITVF